VAALLALKLAALALLWLLFFSPAHRPSVDAARESQRFGLSAPQASPAPAPPSVSRAPPGRVP